MGAVRDDPKLLESASERLRSHKGIVGVAVRKSPSGLKFAGSELLSDRSFLLDLCTSDIRIYPEVPNSFQGDLTFALDVLRG